MQVNHLVCKNFRRFEYLDFHPEAGLNIICGDNAQGKTSLLEALLFLATARSHRTSRETELVRDGSDTFHLHVSVSQTIRPLELEVNWWCNTKRFKVNGIAQARVSDILGQTHIVMFSPEDIALVQGGAAVRRRFMDMELSQLEPLYLRALQRYRQVLRQRNELLRSLRPDETQLDVWDAQLVQEGCILIERREAFIDELAQNAARVYATLTGHENLEITYRPDHRAAGTFEETLAASRAVDIRQNMTTRGPHRDDVLISVNRKNARQYCSQGQQRTAAIAIKLAELNLLHDHLGEYPILLLDDVLSELDAHRVKRLFSWLNQDIQCLLTTTGQYKSCAMEYDLSCAGFIMKEGCIART